jgi:hypothetical protein
MTHLQITMTQWLSVVNAVSDVRIIYSLVALLLNDERAIENPDRTDNFIYHDPNHIKYKDLEIQKELLKFAKLLMPS